MCILMVNVVIKVILGISLWEFGYELGMYFEEEGVYVKVLVFLFVKLCCVDIMFGFEMKFIGEVMG